MATLRYQIDVQISPQKTLVLKIYDGDKAEEILQSLHEMVSLELDQVSFQKLEYVIRTHCQL